MTDREDSKPIFRHVTLPHDNVSPFQVWLKTAEQFRSIVQTKLDTWSMTDGQTDTVTAYKMLESFTFHSLHDNQSSLVIPRRC